MTPRFSATYVAAGVSSVEPNTEDTRSLAEHSRYFDTNGGWPGHGTDDWFRAESELLHPVYLEIVRVQPKTA